MLRTDHSAFFYLQSGHLPPDLEGFPSPDYSYNKKKQLVFLSTTRKRMKDTRKRLVGRNAGRQTPSSQPYPAQHKLCELHPVADNTGGPMLVTSSCRTDRKTLQV